MVDLITNNIDIWSTAQTIKTNGRGRSADNQSLHGIKKLRELILELAVRGKLVPQDPNDEPASVLLDKIATEKARLIKEGKIKEQKPLHKISEDEKPFVLPKGWEWARLPDFSAYKPGKTPSTKNPIYWADDNVSGIPWVSISDMEHFGLVADTNKRVTQEAVDQVFKYDVIPTGSLLMSFKLTVGKISILDIDAYHNEAIISIQPFTGLNRDYLFKFLPKCALAGNTKSAIMGNTLNADSLALLLIPVPPLAEQHRIVAKVDELMALCDRLEKQQTDSNAAHQTLVEILLTTLTDAADQGELETAWQRIASHFDTLFTTEHSIDQLKQTILQLAIMGKLVPQDPNDEPASVLLDKIAKEKMRLINDGKIKKREHLPKISEDERPFEAPPHWSWIRLQELLPEFQNGESSRGDPGGVPTVVLRLADINDYQISLANTRVIPVAKNSMAKYSLSNGDILIVRVNGSTEIVGRFIVCDAGLGAIYCDHFIRMRICSDWITPRFIGLLGSTYLIRGQIKNLFITTAGQKTVNQGHISSLTIPLPPLPEQHRIVAKVDELMAICDTLKARLSDAQATQIQLADAIVERAVA